MSEAGYYDIHNHILPGIDDGAKNMEETISLLQMEYKDGVRYLIFTPHYVPSSELQKNADRAERTRKVFEKVKIECNRLFPQMKVYLGNELYYRRNIVTELDEKRANTMAGSRFILTEFPTNLNYNELKKAMQQYLFGSYLPILAHMERYQCLYKNFDRLRELKNMGCFLQMNTENFLQGPFSSNKKFCTRAVKEGYVDFLATDSHDCRIRKPTLLPAVEYLEKKADFNILRKILYENPKKLLDEK